MAFNLIKGLKGTFTTRSDEMIDENSHHKEKEGFSRILFCFVFTTEEGRKRDTKWKQRVKMNDE